MMHSDYLKPDCLTPELLAMLRKMADEAKQEGTTLSDKALQWVLQQKGITSVLAGASKVEQIERNISAALRA